MLVSQAASPIVKRCDMIWPEHALARTNDQYIFLQDTLVAPVFNTSQNLTSRSVWIPPGAWEDAWSGETIIGPTTRSVEQPYERIPMWHRKGGLMILSGDTNALRVEDQDWSSLTIEAWLPMPAAAGSSSNSNEPVTRMLYERSSGASTEVTFHYIPADDMARIEISEASDGTVRGWLLRLHLSPRQRIAVGVQGLVDGRIAALTSVTPRNGDSAAAHFPLRGEGALPAHRTGPIVELRVPSGAGRRTLAVPIETTL